MKVYIKNMVCNRCKSAVNAAFEILGFHVLHTDLGVVETEEVSIEEKRDALVTRLGSMGFDLIEDKKVTTAERIKNLIIDLVHHKDSELNTTLSVYLSRILLQDYTSLSNLFSEIEHTTIEKYFIIQRIERVKELLMYDELTLSEIAIKLNYSSIAYLSNQFKKITGVSPSSYRKLKEKNRIQLDKL